MELKKKSRNLLKYFCRISNVVLLFMVFLGCSSHCFANVTEEYIEYCFDTLSTYSTHSTYTDRNRGWIKLFADSNSAITNVTDTINNFLDDNNISALQNVNCICLTQTQNQNYCNIYFIFSNVSAPNGVSDLDFVEFQYEYFQPHSINGTDKIYFIEFSIKNNLYYELTTSVLSNIGRSISHMPFTVDDNNSILTSTNFACCGLPSVYYKLSPSITSPFIAIDPNGNFNSSPAEPDQPSGDSPVEPSGDTPSYPSGDSGGGSVIDYTNQLNNINTSINNVNNSVQNVQNQISGDTKKITNSIDNLNNTLTSPADMDNITITSGDILGNFSFMEDPYSNFWWDFIDGVELALLGNVRQLPVNWLGYNRVF